MKKTILMLAGAMLSILAPAAPVMAAPDQDKPAVAAAAQPKAVVIDVVYLQGGSAHLSSMVTLDGTMVPLSLTNTRYYRKSISYEKAKATNGEVEKGNIEKVVEVAPLTTGFVARMTPTVLADGSVNLMVGVDVSELLSMATHGSGADAIELPDVYSAQIQQSLNLKPGVEVTLPMPRGTEVRSGIPADSLKLTVKVVDRAATPALASYAK